jgi:glycosyltransferase involved in cell wall biosynthesis
LPRYSVILPTRNRSDVIGYAIQSVLSQSDGDFELLVVGDGCTDDTAAVVAAYGDRRVRWFDLPKAPFFGYANRNVVLKDAQGEFIAYMAHDDLICHDHLERLSGQLDDEQAEWIFSRPLWVSMDGVVVPYAVTLLHDDQRASYMSEGNPIPMSCVMHRRSAIARAGLWPEDLPASADWAYWKQILAGGTRLSSCRVPTTLHFVADWRRAQQIWQPEAMVLLRTAMTESWWPPALWRRIPAGETEQAVFWRWLSTGADATTELRRAVDLVIDRLAWDRTADLRNRASARSLSARVARRLGALVRRRAP